MAMELPPTVAFSMLQLLMSGAAAAVVSCLVFTSLLGTAKLKGRALGIEKSNLADEFEHDADGDGDWKVKSLWIYPVKSCRGVELDEANVVPTGFEYDRQFMLAEKKTNPGTGSSEWQFITQRSYPRMALITPTIHSHPKHPTGGTLTISFPLPTRFFRPRTRTFSVPLAADEDLMAAYPLTPVKIWREYPLGHDMSAAAGAGTLAELRRFLEAKEEIALFRVAKKGIREVYRNAPRVEELGWQPVVGFADAYPLHLLNLASVRELNGRIKDKIPELSVNRFRANIIVSGPRAFHEDDWKKISLGGKMYYSTSHTVRCRLPNVNQETGEKHMQEPDKTLRSYRNIDKGSPNNACLGMQLVPADQNSTLKVGDRLVVHETGEHLYLPLFS